MQQNTNRSESNLPTHGYTCTLLVALLLLLTGCAIGQVREPTNICSIFEQKRSWYRAALKSEKKWNIPMEIPMAILYQESTFRARAKPPRKRYLGFIPGPRLSSAYGYAQAINGTWLTYTRDTGEHWRDRDDFSDALDFVNYYVNEAVEKNGVSRSDAYHLYLNYHEGLAGFRSRKWQQKSSLQKTARRVQQRAGVYQQQLAGCQDGLKRGWLF